MEGNKCLLDANAVLRFLLRDVCSIIEMEKVPDQKRKKFQNKNGESSFSKMEKIPAVMEKPLGTGSTL